MKEATDAAWERCKPYIEAALHHARGTHTVDDVWAAVQIGDAQFWPGERSAVVTEILHFPRKKALHFWLCGGDLKELVETIRPAIEAWGVEQGCAVATTAGRNGWRRALEGHGYEPAWHVCTKELAA